LSTTRDREKTKSKLIKAVEQVLVQHGAKALGVNAVATQAKIDKALIYRYFGDFNGLLVAFAEYITQGDAPDNFFPEEFVKNTSGDNPYENYLNFQRYALDMLVENKLMQNILVLELIQPSEATDIISKARHDYMKKAIVRMGLDKADIDQQAVMGCFAAMMRYFGTVLASGRTTYGVDLKDKGHREELKKCFEGMMAGIFKGQGAGV